MADKSTQLILNALTRATAEAAGALLHGKKSEPGLFPTTTLGKQAAQRCLDEGWLRPVEPDRAAPPPTAASTPRTAAPPLVVAITDKGRTHLLGQVSPRQVLEDFVRVLESRESQVAQLIGLARQMQTSLEAMRDGIAPVLREAACTPFGPKPTSNGELKGLFHEFHQEKPAAPASHDLAAELLRCLEAWPRSGASEDCPLPELFRQTVAAAPGTSIGAFHDILRQLQDAGRIYLHPWTGPLCDMPEPPYSLLVGHEVAYYASLTNKE